MSLTSRLVIRPSGLAGLLGAALLAGAAHAGDTRVSTEADASRPYLVTIHADWCGTCTRIEKPLEALRRQEGSNARYVVLDVTDRAALTASQAEADRLGIRDFFDRYKGSTGTVGVLDGATRKPVSVLRGQTSVAVYQSALRKARGESAS